MGMSGMGKCSCSGGCKSIDSVPRYKGRWKYWNLEVHTYINIDVDVGGGRKEVEGRR